MNSTLTFEEASRRGLLERLSECRSILGLAGSLVFAALLASACGSVATGETRLTGPTPSLTLGAVLPNATATAAPEPVLVAAATPEPPAATTGPSTLLPVNPTAPALPMSAPAATPPTTGLPPLLSFNGRADDLDVMMTVSPARAGPNEVNFFFYDTNGDDRSIEKLIARFIFVDFAAPPVVVEMVEAHPGHANIIDH